MKTNKKHIIIPALMMAVGVGLVGSISGTVAWYQYSTRVQTSYMGASAHCSESLKVSLTGEEGSFVSELTSAQIKDAAKRINPSSETDLARWDGTNFQPVTNGNGAKMYGHPIYQNFAYNRWQSAPRQSYLQYDLYFRVLDVDGKAAPSYIAKALYIEDITLQFQGSSGSASATAFKNAVRISIENKTSGQTATHLLSQTARTDMALYGKLDLNGDNAYDKELGYEFDENGSERNATNNNLLEEIYYGVEYSGDPLVPDLTNAPKQTTKAFSSYICPVSDNQLAPAEDDSSTTDVNEATPSLGTTVAAPASTGETPASTYNKDTALHFEVKVWLEGWDATGDTPETSIWDAKDYVGNFQLGMRFGITNHEAH